MEPFQNNLKYVSKSIDDVYMSIASLRLPAWQQYYNSDYLNSCRDSPHKLAPSVARTLDTSTAKSPHHDLLQLPWTAGKTPSIPSDKDQSVWPNNSVDLLIPAMASMPHCRRNTTALQTTSSWLTASGLAETSIYTRPQTKKPTVWSEV